jgi:hypothetical protein
MEFGLGTMSKLNVIRDNHAVFEALDGESIDLELMLAHLSRAVDDRRDLIAMVRDRDRVLDKLQAAVDCAPLDNEAVDVFMHILGKRPDETT